MNCYKLLCILTRHAQNDTRRRTGAASRRGPKAGLGASGTGRAGPPPPSFLRISRVFVYTLLRFDMALPDYLENQTKISQKIPFWNVHKYVGNIKTKT